MLKGNKVLHPPVRTDGLELYYDTKGKKNTDTHKDKLLDMSGNDRHGELHNFSYKNLSGYQEDSELVFDGIDDTLTMPKLNDINPSNFTYQLNNNILAFTGDEVKTVKNENIEINGRNLISESLIGRNGLDSMDISRYVPKGVISFSKSKGYDGISIRAHPLLPNTEYVMSYRYRKTSGTLVSFGGHTDNSWRNNKAYVDGIEGGSYSGTSSVFVSDDEIEHEVVIYINTPSEIAVNNLIYIQPNRGSATSVGIDVYDLKLEKGNMVTNWTPAPEDLLEVTELKGNILGDMEDIVDDHTRDEQSGVEVFTDKADDSLVRVEVDGKSYQHAGSGKNLIPLQGWDLRGDAYVDEDSGYIYSSFSSFAYSPYVKIKPNTDYTYSHYGSPHRASLLFLDINKDTIASYTSWDGVGTLSSPDNAYYFKRYATDTSLQTELEGFKFQLEEGSTATAYELPAPTPDYPIEIHSLNDFDVVSSAGRRNLLPTTYNLFTRDGGTYGFYKFLDEPEQVIVTVRDRDTSVDMRSIYFGFTDIGHNFGRGTWLMANGNLQLREQLSNYQNYFSYYPNNEKALNKIFQRFYIQIEKGTIATDWTPAPEDITENDNHSLIDKINLLLSEPLRSVGDVKDRLFRDGDGLWKIERNIYSQLLNGSESWGPMTNLNDNDFLGFHFYTEVNRTGSYTSVMSSHFTQGTGDIAPVNRFSEERNLMGIQVVGGQTKVIINSNILPSKDIDGFRNWLKNNNVRIQYIKSNFSIETLDQEIQDKLNNLRSFQDSNYVYTIINEADGLPSHISENLKPTIHTEFLAKDHYKENRTVNNLLIWNRSLEDEELLKQNKLFHERFDMRSDTVKGEPINEEINLIQGGYPANTLSLEYTIEI